MHKTPTSKKKIIRLALDPSPPALESHDPFLSGRSQQSKHCLGCPNYLCSSMEEELAYCPTTDGTGLLVL